MERVEAEVVMVVRRGRRAGEGKDGQDGHQSRKELAVVGSSGRASVAEASAPRRGAQRAQVGEELFATK